MTPAGLFHHRVAINMSVARVRRIVENRAKTGAISHRNRAWLRAHYPLPRIRQPRLVDRLS